MCDVRIREFKPLESKRGEKLCGISSNWKECSLGSCLASESLGEEAEQRNWNLMNVGEMAYKMAFGCRSPFL